MKDIIKQANQEINFRSDVMKDIIKQANQEINEDFIKGFLFAMEWLRNDELPENDNYGIGSMLSQWTASAIADDMEEKFISYVELLKSHA